MSKQNKDFKCNNKQKKILDLEKKYMDILESIVMSKDFIDDLKNIEADVQEYYNLIKKAWGKKNKINEASERLLRHHMYAHFSECKKFYPFPISSDIALELEDVILNIDVKTIDKIGNKQEINTTQFEHNQTSFINKPVFAKGSFPGLPIKSNLQTTDPRTDKPLLSYLLKICYADDDKGNFNLLNTEKIPSLVLTCLPNGTISELFENNLFSGFKDYNYFGNKSKPYYKRKYITSRKDFDSLTLENQFLKMEQTIDIPDDWERLALDNKVGYYDLAQKQLWLTVNKKSGNHQEVYLYAVKSGNTGRYNDEWLKDRYDSKGKQWDGQRKYFKIYG